MTFHKNRGPLSKIVLTAIIIFGIVQLYFFFVSEFGVWTSELYYLRVSLDLVYTLITFNWLAISAFSAYKLIKDQEIEPWVKMRYKLITIFSFIFSFHSIPEFFQPAGVTWGNPSNIVSLQVFGSTAILVVIFSLGFSIAWIMPKWLKRFLNRNYIIDKDILIDEKELLNLIRQELSNNEKDS
jgi:hypothetical protein